MAGSGLHKGSPGGGGYAFSLQLGTESIPLCVGVIRSPAVISYVKIPTCGWPPTPSTREHMFTESEKHTYTWAVLFRASRKRMCRGNVIIDGPWVLGYFLLCGSSCLAC